MIAPPGRNFAARIMTRKQENHSMDAGFWIEIAILVLRIFAAGIAG